MTQSADALTSPNGPPSLTDRVKGLSLDARLDSPKGGRGGSAWLPWILCLLMGLTWASFGVRAYTSGGWKALFGGKSDDKTGPVTADATKKDKSSAAPTSPDELVLTVKGYIVAAHQIQVGPDRVSGKITKLDVNFVEGRFFKEGAVLAEIDKIDYESDYRQGKAAREALYAQLEEMWNGARKEEREQAEAQVDEALAMLEQAVSDLRRIERVATQGTALAPEPLRPNGDKKARVAAVIQSAVHGVNRIKAIRNQGQSISEKELIQTVSDTETRSARLEQAVKNWELVLLGPRQERIDAMTAQFDQAVARERLAREMLKRCDIRAPVSGIILSKRTEIGNLVNPLAMNTNFNGGICEMADLTDLEVDLEIQEREISKVFKNQNCIVRADAYPERRYSARVDRIMPVANRSLSIIPIRVKVRVQREEEGKYLKPQMGVVVTFYNRDAGPDGPAKPPLQDE